ncbi:MAG: radical SAM protein [Lachnospiraceae bacterium]|nr:radical SAM protein [Lachnospiraceae bacterium]MDE6184180.1 radical SAM protein [Lachnospiraceae bacterium]
MKYKPITCVWEVTMGCNMRCGHCGSSCAEALLDELSTEEALNLCDQIAELGLNWITISGGEPLTRKDVPMLVERLSSSGVAVNIITNGWLLGGETAQKLKESGISTVAISIDGTPEIHDSIRKEGAFEHAKNAFLAMEKLGIYTGAVTTITKQNINILNELKEELIKMGVKSWQIQLGLPMGSLKERPDWVLEPTQIRDIIDFAYDTAKEGRIAIYLADCIGYYTKKEIEIKKIAYQTNLIASWDGCNAGTRGFGILQNGDILGCTSIRSKEFIEGNIRQHTLREIWEDENNFLWRRKMTKDKLNGACRNCVYGSKCLGGCPNTRLTMNGDIYSENQYCAYHLSFKQMEDKYAVCKDAESLFKLADALMRQGDYQEAAFALGQVLQLDPENADALKEKGYCEFMCGNYDSCLEANEKVLKTNEKDSYALGGYAMALFQMGQKGEGLKKMRQAVELTGGRDQDLIQDLRFMLANESR